MIQLHPDCLIFRTSQGELIPCSAESVTIEMIGDASSVIDPETRVGLFVSVSTRSEISSASTVITSSAITFVPRDAVCSDHVASVDIEST